MRDRLYSVCGVLAPGVSYPAIARRAGEKVALAAVRPPIAAATGNTLIPMVALYSALVAEESIKRC